MSRSAQTIRIVVEQAAPNTAARPEIDADALRSAQVEQKRGKARL